MDTASEPLRGRPVDLSGVSPERADVEKSRVELAGGGIAAPMRGMRGLGRGRELSVGGVSGRGLL